MDFQERAIRVLRPFPLDMGLDDDKPCMLS